MHQYNRGLHIFYSGIAAIQHYNKLPQMYCNCAFVLRQ